MVRLSGLLFSCLCFSLANADEITFLTWEDYIDPELVEAFEAESGHEVVFVYYDHDEERDRIMAETTGYGFDVILVDEAEISAYVSQGWLVPLDTSKLPSLELHGNQWSDLVPSAKEYAAPYGWGTYGIIYRSDKIDSPPLSWAQLFSPDDALQGRIQMSPQAAELLAVALIAAGYSPSESDSEALMAAQKLILNQQRFVRTYQPVDFDPETSDILKGDVWVSMGYNADAVYLQDEIDDIDFISPADGTILWVDLMAVSNKSQHKTAAHELIEFLLQPENAAQNVEYHYTASFSKAVNALLPTEISESEVVYPTLGLSLQTLGAPNRQSIRTMMRLVNQLELSD